MLKGQWSSSVLICFISNLFVGHTILMHTMQVAERFKKEHLYFSITWLRNKRMFDKVRTLTAFCQFFHTTAKFKLAHYRM